MLSTIRRDLKDNIGDQFRGFRHLIHTLSSDAPAISVANQPLPPLPAELSRLVGGTLQTVDGVMTTLQSLVTPLRDLRSPEAGFREFSYYFGAAGGMASGDEEELTDDLYAALKLITKGVGPARLILKARVTAAARQVMTASRSERWTVDDLGTCCATVFVAFVKHEPIASIGNAHDSETWKLYAALSLAFALSISDRLTGSEFQSFTPDAIRVCNLRSEVFQEAIRSGSKTDALVKTCTSLLKHLP